jgi:DNA-binding NtrC family response regulator
LRKNDDGTSVAFPAVTMMTKEAVQSVTTIPPVSTSAPLTPISLDDRLRELEASLISWALSVSRGNKSKAARLLLVKRSTLGDRINRCGLGRRTEQTVSTVRPVQEQESALVGR